MIDSKFRHVLFFSIFACTFLLAINIFFIYLFDIFSLYLMFIDMFAWLVFIIAIVWSLVSYMRTKLNKGKSNFVPILINLLVLLLIIFFPISETVERIDFKVNLKEREQVVQLIESGALKPNIEYNSSLIELPDKYKYLSRGGGEVFVENDGENQKIFFYTYRGILDNFSGFAYISSNNELGNTDFEGDFSVIKKVKEHWYYGISN